MLDLIKVIVTLVILVKASLDDLRTREISNKIWIIMILIALILNVIQYAIHKFDVLSAIIQFLVVFAIANAMYYLFGFGGADCKALICLAVMFPIYPKIFDFTVPGQIFTLSVLVDSAIPIVFLVLMNFVRNAIKGNFGLLMFLGYRVKIGKIPRFHNLLEYVKNGRVVHSLRGVEPNDKILDDLRRIGIEYVWITPVLPFITFITFGFVLAVILGDLMIILIRLYFC